MKFMVNTCYGGFNLSAKALARLKELGLQPAVNRLPNESNENYNYRAYEAPLRDNRFHPLLVQVVEELGKEASGSCAELKIAVLNPDYLTSMLIEEHDGYESVKWPATIPYDDDDDD